MELVPEVSSLARGYFSEANGNFHARTNTRVIVDDARNFLRGTTEKFDVIVSDIVVPWQQGEAALYTLEHFTAARRALGTNGVFCVWIPAFQLGQTEFNILLRTFLSVFGSASVWRGDFSPNRPAIGLVAPVAQFDVSTIDRRVREMTPDPANRHVANPRAFWMHFVGFVESGDLGERRVNSENRPWIELLASRHSTSGFTGESLLSWQREVANRTSLAEGAAAGQAAGILMAEFTLALSERRQQRAREIQRSIRQTLGEEAFRLVFDSN